LKSKIAIVDNISMSEFIYECNCGQIETNRIGLKKHYFQC